MGHDHASVPRPALWGVAVLILGALVLAGVARFTGVGATRMPEGTVITSIDLRFVDRPDGSVLVLRAADHTLIGQFAPTTNGFARSTLRTFVRQRHRENVGAQTPFRLTRWADGRLSLSDPATGRQIELDVFGPTNVGVFADLLTAGVSH
jgi:putative photosynthetic complex assembly protein